jgi:cupin fold WbuC family metalloprotein
MFPFKVVSVADVKSLILTAASSPNQTTRLCLHPDHASSVQEMIIAMTQSAYFAPHRHPPGWSESYHVMVGAIEVCLFSENLMQNQRIILEANSTFMYRIDQPIFHSVRSLTPSAVYHEVLRGPYNRDTVVLEHPNAPKTLSDYLNRFGFESER